MRTLMGLISGGKDSLYAVFLSYLHSFHIKFLGALLPPEDSMLLHIPNVRWVNYIGKAMNMQVKILRGEIERIGELAKGVEWISVGALASDYQRLRFVWAASKNGLRVYSPLWHLRPERYVRKMVEDGFRFIVTSVGAEGMERWLGKEINPNNVETFLGDLEEIGAHPAGEGGEYESFVVDSPLYRYRLSVKGKIQGKDYLIEEVKLVDKH